MFKKMTKRGRRWTTASVLALATMSLAACGSSVGDKAAEVENDPNAEILVWTDATRKPAFDMYQEANPDIKMKVETVDITAVTSKIQLANRAKEGWPDVVFVHPGDLAKLASPNLDFAAPVDDVFSDEIKDGFSTTTACTIEDVLYCLQNDIAHDVLWYNKPQMEKFGYEVPTTWAEYAALGEKVAKEHPGHVLGSVGGGNIFYDYLWPSGCPLQKLKSSTEVVINTADEKCTRVADVVDPMLENGSLARLDPAGPEISKMAREGKLLMMPAASWWGEFIMKAETAYNMDDGQVAAAPMPMWEGEETNYSGAQGGGLWVMGKHAKNQTGAAELIEWLATSPDYQLTAPTYPTYAPMAEQWVEKIAADKFYAQDPTPALVEGASKLHPDYQPVRYDALPSVTETLAQNIAQGGTLAEGLPELQKQLESLAEAEGYEVSDS